MFVKQFKINQNKMEESAVEWFHKETWNLKIKLENKVISIGQHANSYHELFEQAKEMFEKQIINASNESFLNSGLVKRGVENKKVLSVGEQYFNETFKSE